MSLTGHYMPLAALTAYIEEGHTGSLHPHDALRIYTAQPCKMTILLGPALSIEPDIQKKNPLPCHARKFYGNAGAVYPVDEAQFCTAGCHHGPGIAGSGESIYLPGREHLETAHKGRPYLAGHGHGRMVREGYLLRTVHNNEITGAAAYTVTDSGNSLLISEEIYLEPASAPYQCLQRAGDLIVRGEIAAHGVKADSQLPHADLLYVLLNHQTSAVVAALRAYAVIQYCGSTVGACGKCGESQFVMSSAFVPALL